MSPRITNMPLSGGDRKSQAKGIRHAHGLHNSQYRQSGLIRSAAEEKLREADRLECEAWNAILIARPAGRSRSETARIASSWASLFSIPHSVAWFTTTRADSWHDPSRGGLCSSAASSLTSPRRAAGCFS
jgi:hypothetical protein